MRPILALSLFLLAAVAHGQTPTKLALTTSMVSTTSPVIAGFEPTRLVDEQALAGNPVAGASTPQPLTMWGTNLAQQSMTAKIDLGASYVITKVMYYDGTGQETAPKYYTITATTTGGELSSK
jgi:hypothetical protein